jgi:DNA invertase Pin-like site-specific DNA recombinase
MYRSVQRPLHLLIHRGFPMAKGRFVSYLRVSTDRQGRSGLGLDAQRKAVEDYLNGGAWHLLREFVEVESGRRSDRPELERALELCRAHRAALVVAKVDRLARSQSFLSKLSDARVDVRFCDLPQIEGPTGKFLLQSMMAVAELEAGMISARTKAALAAARARGKKLGGFRGRRGTAKDLAKARAARTGAAVSHAKSLAPIISRLEADGPLGLRGLARALNEEGVPTATGRGEWTAAGVARLQAHLRAGA